MLPELSPGVNADTSSAPPPLRFRPLEGTPRLVQWKPSDARGSVGLTEAQKNGLRYEAKAQDFLIEQLGPNYFPAPFLHFMTGSNYRTLIPDGLYFTPHGLVVIFEIKSQHMPEAWWQLRKLYEPVVKQLPLCTKTSCVEVVKSFDPSMGFPERIRLCSNITDAICRPAEDFKVLHWRP